jgi:hypothetical protein
MLRFALAVSVLALIASVLPAVAAPPAQDQGTGKSKEIVVLIPLKWIDAGMLAQSLGGTVIAGTTIIGPIGAPSMLNSPYGGGYGSQGLGGNNLGQGGGGSYGGNGGYGFGSPGGLSAGQFPGYQGGTPYGGGTSRASPLGRRPGL